MNSRQTEERRTEGFLGEDAVALGEHHGTVSLIDYTPCKELDKSHVRRRGDLIEFVFRRNI